MFYFDPNVTEIYLHFSPIHSELKLLYFDQIFITFSS